MKKTIVITVIVTLIFCIALLAIPRHNLPTDAEWKEYLKWEQEYFEWRDNLPEDYCKYQVQNRDTQEVYLQGTLTECKNFIAVYEAEIGECVVMPYLPLEK